MSPPIPAWMAELDAEDWSFVKRFIVASGSLKELAGVYAVSYPTVRSRLDRLIAKVEAADDPAPRDPFERKIRILVADGRLSPQVAKQLLTAHKSSLRQPPNTRKRGATS